MLICVSLVLFILLMVLQWRYRNITYLNNHLEKSLQDRTEELIAKNHQLEHMERQNLLMVEQSLKFKEMDRLKSRFFADISHEFRTPLTLIIGTLEHIRYENRDKEIEKSIRRILNNSKQLLGLINQLLDLARFECGKMKLRAVSQNIIPIIRGIVDSFHFFARQNRLELSLISNIDNVILYFDREKLEKILINLLANAMKFTPPGGKISVTIIPCPNGKHIKISVVDNGVGIPNHQLQYIFDRYYKKKKKKGDLNPHYEQKGTGIGLALTKELINLHHGTINVHSTVGQGTEFVVKLPLGDKHLISDEKIKNFTTISNKSSDYPKVMFEPLNNYSSIEKKEGKKQEIVTQGKQDDKNLVLVVEDSKEMREFLRVPFKRLFNLIEASNGREGIEKAEKFIPDLILSDVLMPELDGYELCRGLKNNLRTSHIPIILLSAKASDTSIIRGLETNADDYIIKPFNTRMLSLRMQNLIHSRREYKKSLQQQILRNPDEISVPSMDTQFFKEVRLLIEKNLSDPEFNVELLAKKMYISRSGLYKKIYAFIGETPVEFIRNFRLERAKQLLEANYGNITEIAQEVGFANVAYFTKCFKELFKRKPSEIIAR